MRRRWPSFLLIALTAAATAADLRIDDVRLTYAWLPDSVTDMAGAADHTASDGSVDDHGLAFVQSLDEPRQRLGLGWFRSLRAMEAGRGSMVLGGEVVVDQRGDSPKLVQRSWLLDAFVGWGWPLTEAWHLEQGFVVGGGVQRNVYTQRRFADGTTPFSDGSRFHAESTDPAYEYGIRIGARWTHPSGLQAGLDLSYLVLHASPDFSQSRDVGGGVIERNTYSPRLTQEGVAVSVSVGYRR